MDNSENSGIRGKYSFPLCGGMRGSHIDTLDIELELDTETVFEMGEYFMSGESSLEVDTYEWGIKDSLDEEYSAATRSSLLKEWGLFGRLLRRTAEEYLADADTKEENESLADGILESLADKISESTEEIISDLNGSYFLDDYFDYAKECMYDDVNGYKDIGIDTDGVRDWLDVLLYERMDNCSFEWDEQLKEDCVNYVKKMKRPVLIEILQKALETIPEHEITCEVSAKFEDGESVDVSEIEMTLTISEIMGILSKRIDEKDLFEGIEMAELQDVATLIGKESPSLEISTNIEEVLESDEFLQELTYIITEFLNYEIDEDDLQSRIEDLDYL